MTGPSYQWRTLRKLGWLKSSKTSSEPQPYIEHLPVELLAKVVLLALPLPDTNALEHPHGCTDHMRSLYRLRRVSRTWKEVVDTTPDVWALVSWVFSDHVNTSNMDKSRNKPLIVGCSKKTEWHPVPVSCCIRFLQLIEPARHRWQVIWLDYVFPDGLSHYLANPAPILETIHVRCSIESPHHEAFPLFGHHVSTIRYVNVIHFAFRPSAFCNLTHFSLCSIWGVTFTVDWITEVLRGSPQLERLCLTNLDLQIPALPSPIASIDLVYLKTFKLRRIDGRAMDHLIRLIDAPNCIQLELHCDGPGADDYDPSLLLESALTSFEPIIQNIIYTLPCPIVSIDADSISWGQYTPPNLDSDLTPFCHLCIKRVSFLAIIRWVERVVESVVESTRLDRGPALSTSFPGSFRISSTTLLRNAEIASRLKHLKSITHIKATESTVDVGQLLQLLGDVGPEPWFPCLENLAVHAYGWEARRLLEMLRTRSYRSSQLVPRIVMIQTRFHGDFAGRGKRVVFDPEIRREIRAIKGVNVVYPDDEDMHPGRKIRTHRRMERSPLQEFIYSASFLPVLAFAFGIYVIFLTS